MNDTGPIRLIFGGEVQEILDLFTGIFGIRIAYFSPGGSELRVGLGREGCRYCCSPTWRSTPTNTWA
jgi:hypothetical protein